MIIRVILSLITAQSIICRWNTARSVLERHLAGARERVISFCF